MVYARLCVGGCFGWCVLCSYIINTYIATGLSDKPGQTMVIANYILYNYSHNNLVIVAIVLFDGQPQGFPL